MSGAGQQRGFSLAEFEQRTARAQAMMADVRLDAVMVTTPPNILYFTGFMSEFWQSPTRPWFVIVPARGKPIAVIPEIGAAAFAATWLDDIRTWPAPRPQDDGVSVLVQTLKDCCGHHGRIGMTLGHETHLRMPVESFRAVASGLAPVEIIDCTDLMRRLRVIKSELEINRIRAVCELTSDAYVALPGTVSAGESERAICQRLKIDILARGADAIPFMASASGPGGYDSIILTPGERVPAVGDLMIIDTGATIDGYFCDFDRNFAFGGAGEALLKAYDTAYRATDVGIAAARPGARMRDIWAAIWAVLEAGGALGYEVGRLGHGLGLQLTEWPSIHPDDDTIVEPGMVLTIEPGMAFAPGKLMVHEENVVIREHGAELLTRRAPASLPVVA